MFSKQKLAKEFEKLAKRFLTPSRRKELLHSIQSDKTSWFAWISQVKNILKKLDKTEAVKFAGFALLLEQNPDSRSYQDTMKRFLTDKIEYYKYYDFHLEKKLAKDQKTKSVFWTNKILRLFISRSFLGIIIVLLIVGFIGWFYLDKDGCVEFVSKVVQPFLKAIR